MKKSKGDKIFDAINVMFMLLLAFCMIYPFWYAFIISLNDGIDAMKGDIYFWPRVFSLENYKAVLRDGAIVRSYGVTIAVTIISTLISLSVCSMSAYSLSRKDLPFVKQIQFFIFFTSIFGGGLIPTYLLYKDINIINTYWVYLLPNTVSFYNILLFKSYFETNVPTSIYEAAVIDGSSESRTFFTIYLPLSKPILATVALFVAVGKWNDWFTGCYYIKDPKMLTLGALLRKMTVQLDVNNMSEQAAQFFSEGVQSSVTSTSFKMAVLIMTTLPILFAYPFLQKYFVKGVAIGSIKE